jgi:hypothetical protein
MNSSPSTFVCHLMEIAIRWLDELFNQISPISTDENNCPKCQEVLQELENIDAETDNLDITFVKIRDTSLLKNFPTFSGLNALISRQLRSGVPKPEIFVSYRNTNLLWLLPLNFHGYLEGYLRKLFYSSLSS